MKLSVIIPALNEEASIAFAVRSAWQAGADEVLVADGGSRDATAENARRAGGQIVPSASGRAVQQNAGAARATGDVLLFLHADCRLSPDCGKQLREALDRPGVLAGAFRQRIDAPGIAYRFWEWGNAQRVRWTGLAYGDQAIFVRHETFNRLAGFPSVRLMEDVVLMQQLRRSSWPVLLPGPVHVSARRWQQYGLVRQTLRNWSLLAAFHLGVPPDRLARFYPRHERKQPAERPTATDASAQQD